MAVLKFDKIRDFLQFLKFVKFEFSNYGLYHTRSGTKGNNDKCCAGLLCWMQDLDSHDELVDETDEVSESGETAFPTSECHQGVDANDDRRARLQWRLEEVRVIKYGTLGRLVAALSDDSGQMDVSNVNTFLTTCRTFASTGEVVDELIKRSVVQYNTTLFNSKC